jgi:hypothetical protein
MMNLELWKVRSSLEEEKVDSNKPFGGGQERADGHSLSSNNINAA